MASRGFWQNTKCLPEASLRKRSFVRSRPSRIRGQPTLKENEEGFDTNFTQLALLRCTVMTQFGPIVPFFFCFFFLHAYSNVAASNDFYYVKRCESRDPNVNECLRDSTNRLIGHIRAGIPELELKEPEPILIDRIQIVLGTGPEGYRAVFRAIEAYGVSNCTVTAVRSDIDTDQFQFTLYIPRISVRALYESSGVLLLVRASGGGNYWGEYEGVKVKCYIKATRAQARDGHIYLRLQQIKMDFSVKDIRMGVDGIKNGNSVLEAALNLFINTNAQELLTEMKPDLKKKFLLLMRDFVSNIFDNVPYDAILT